MFLSGIDIGGTSIKFGIFDEQLNLLQQWSRPTPKEPAEAAALIAAQLEPYHVAAIGAGAPGTLNAARETITADNLASALIKPSGRWERRNASIACRAKRSSALMASAIAMLKISLGAASGQFPPRKKFCGIDIFLRVDRRRAARFPYNGNFTVYGEFPAIFSRQRKGYQPCSPQCTGRGYWWGTGNYSGLPQSAAPQPSQRLPRHKVGRSIGSINKPFFLIQGLL